MGFLELQISTYSCIPSRFILFRQPPFSVYIPKSGIHFPKARTLARSGNSLHVLMLCCHLSKKKKVCSGIWASAYLACFILATCQLSASSFLNGRFCNVFAGFMAGHPDYIAALFEGSSHCGAPSLFDDGRLLCV